MVKNYAISLEVIRNRPSAIRGKVSPKFKGVSYGEENREVVFKWKDHQEGGKRDGKCVGNGKEKDWKKKNEKENREELVASNNSFVYFCIIINIKKKILFWEYEKEV